MPKHLFLIAVACCLLILTGANPPSQYLFPMKGYYDLSGTFAELRGNHFHGGLDIKTYRRTGIPVLAIEDGYVYRLRTGPYGFGNAVYLKHPDGRFSVYAHLEGFSQQLTDYHWEEQQRAERTDLNSFPAPSKFLVKQGDTIGFSGNSGSSFGPHLHFEIRTPDERPINPLHYFKQEVPDTRKPTLEQIGIQPLTPNSRVNGRYEKLTFKPRGANGSYRHDEPILVKGPIGLEYEAFDQLNGAPNRCGINFARLYLDGELRYQYEMEEFGFDETRAIYLHYDYAHQQATRDRLQRAYRSEGNPLGVYMNSPGEGSISLDDEDPHILRLEMTDLHGNQSTFEATIQQDTTDNRLSQEKLTPKSEPAISYQIAGDFLRIAIEGAPLHCLSDGLWAINEAGQSSLITPDYLQDNTLGFFLPLDPYNYPVEIRDDSGTVQMQVPLVKHIFPDRNNLAESGPCQAFFTYRSAFRPFHLLMWQETTDDEQVLSDVYHFGPTTEPMWQGFTLSIAPDPGISTNGLVIARWDGDEWKYEGGRLDPNGRILARPGQLGTFALVRDTIPPTLRNVSFGNGGQINHNTELVLAVDDEFSGIRYGQIKGYLDDQWVPFELDFKRMVIRASLERLELTSGKKTLTVQIEDGAGNVTKKSFQLTR